MSLVVRADPLNARGRQRRRRGRREMMSRGILGGVSGPSRGPVNAGKLGFPDKLRIKHRFCEVINAGSVAGSPMTYLFSCNGLYDPNITGTGHQPSYFDQVGAIYRHYRVMASTCTVRYWCSQSAYVGLLIDDDTSVPTTIGQLVEQPTSVVDLQLQNTARAITLRKSWNAKDYFGGDIYDNSNLQGDTTANPPEQSYYVLYAQAYDLATTVGIYFIVDIVYDAVWNELATAPTS